MADKLLSISNLDVSYNTYEGKIRAVRGLDLELESGQTLGLVGESGAGKTTTALSIMQLVPNPPGRIDGGKVVFEGRDLCALPEKELMKVRGNRISMIFQNPMSSLNPVVTVGVQISEALRAHRRLSRAEAMKEAQKMLETVQIPAERCREYPHEFSGGMRQRVMIAMALAQNPSMIIADEPTTALDVTIQAQILSLMKELKESTDTAILLITHDMGVVAEMSDRILVMYAGMVMEYGTAGEIFKTPKHPYTQGLLASIPRKDRDVEVLHTIEGTVPTLQTMPEGCRFCTRCQEATDQCMRERPQMFLLGTRQVRCWKYA